MSTDVTMPSESGEKDAKQQKTVTDVAGLVSQPGGSLLHEEGELNAEFPPPPGGGVGADSSGSSSSSSENEEEEGGYAGGYVLLPQGPGEELQSDWSNDGRNLEPGHRSKESAVSTEERTDPNTDDATAVEPPPKMDEGETLGLSSDNQLVLYIRDGNWLKVNYLQIPTLCKS